MKLSPAMQRAVAFLERHGYVDAVHASSGTIVALMRRGILRSALSPDNGFSAGRHYPATTPEQVYAEAWIEHGLRICDEIDAEAAAPRTGVPEVEGRPGPMTMALRATRSATPGVSEGDRRTCIRTDGSHANHVEPVDGMSCDPDALTDEDRAVADRQRAVFASPITPAEQRTGVSDVQASIADEVAALRREIGQFGDKCAEVVGAMEMAGGREADAAQIEADDLSRSITARLDRIAAFVPQRATDRGSMIQQHACGRVATFALHPPYCCANPGGWRALYTVAGR